jgi:putative nucleotidyltransferase with HDIG domain
MRFFRPIPTFPEVASYSFVKHSLANRCASQPRRRRPEELGVERRIRLRGMNGIAKGQVWESATLLRVGRIDLFEIVLNDDSVSRRHAEFRATEQGWRIGDLGSTNGTFLNGQRLGSGQWPLRVKDMVAIGDLTLVVEALEEERRDTETPPPDELRVEATAKSTWEAAIEGLALDSNRSPRPGEQLLALLRAGHHLVHIESEDELLKSILFDAVHVLDAQRGAIVLADGPDGALKPSKIMTGRGEPRAMAAGREVSGRPCFSQSAALRCFSRGESILCQSAQEDPELAVAQSIADGTMSSVLCVLLRTPRTRLGVLHLDRGPWQKPFTADDLHLADALAANVSFGIECSQLLRKQRDLFLNTITTLASTVELRDEYTGGHTLRVSNFSLMLGQKLQLTHADLEWLRVGTPLHDIGKIGIDDAILRKPDKLTPEEFEQMKTHTTKGAEILGTIPDLDPILPIVRSHHERWDGRGYPDRLAGEAIPRLARIVAVADAFDAMTSDRPYRRGMAPEVAFAEVQKQSGKQFDPECAEAFLAIRQQVMEAIRPNSVTSSRTTTRVAKMVKVG